VTAGYFPRRRVARVVAIRTPWFATRTGPVLNAGRLRADTPRDMSEHDIPESFERHRTDPSPAPDSERPDWLVGAEEGAQAEQARGDQAYPHLKLVRPGAPEPRPGAPASPSRPQAWKAAASSVPKLQRVTVDVPARSQPAAPVAPLHGEPARAQSSRSAAPTDRPGAVDAGDTFGDAPAFSPAQEPEADPLAVPSAVPRAAHAPRLDEPWWAIVADALQTNRGLQAGLVVALLAALAWAVWPRSETTVPIRAIHEHPERFDGRQVRVKGKVGDVYEIGGAFAFYLEHNRDTIVVFSRVRRPYRNERLEVAGSVSMGYLDGVARPSLFETTP
jgi:hypothetical protein